jgi:hypothetical protein
MVLGTDILEYSTARTMIITFQFMVLYRGKRDFMYAEGLEKSDGLVGSILSLITIQRCSNGMRICKRKLIKAH